MTADPSRTTEAALVLASCSGDSGAFAELVRRRQGSVRRLLRQLCADASLADDLAQEVFVRAWTSLATVKRPAALGGWLRQVAITTYLQQRRRPSLETSSLDEVGEDREPSREDPARIDLLRALASLSPGERLCVTLFHAEGMSHSEIAAACGLRLGTVKSHVLRGTRRLRARMEVEA